MSDHDLLVIGGGTGGYAAAFRAAQLGRTVTLIEQAKVGGTCLHWGCIPAKAMLETGDLLAKIGKAADFGIEISPATGVDTGTVAARRDRIVNRMHAGLKSLFKKNGVELIAGRATFIDDTTVEVQIFDEAGAPTGEARRLTARDIVIATGSSVRKIPGLETDGQVIVSSDDIVTGTFKPRSVIVVGGGAVGCEFASYFRDLGAETTIVEMLPALVPLEDRDASKELTRAFGKRGIAIHVAHRIVEGSLTKRADGVSLLIEPMEGGAAQPLTADLLVVAAGRVPNSGALGLEATGVKVERGFIQVDAQMRTASPHIYAVGDVIGGLQLAHVAAHEGLIAAQAIAEQPIHAISYVKQPRATYCRPEVASVGATTQELERDGVPFVAGQVPFLAIAKAHVGGDADGFCKVLRHADTGEVLGVHMVGPKVTDLIAEASLALELGATASQLGGTTHPHPTLSEIVGEAALVSIGRSVNF
ncbi:MAG: dihydrolipoyl dehydrogenase [Chloroflexi bacterium]|jgi:dihydrolipoamide dehydrogenase|nr:MAG: dihydrolipoyl dehydrogenase [Chloroflexota bacterium]RLT28655.1 MAG: dihydrolipoyl dehydrogenase [Chloroflexota bacterium]